MTTRTVKIPCVTCKRRNVTYQCDGCEQSFCPQHLAEHQKGLEKQLDDVENERNLLKQTLSQHQQDISKHPLSKQIDRWERNSIRVIQQTAQEARDILHNYTNTHISNIEIKLNKLTDEMKELRIGNDFNEIHLKSLKSELQNIQQELNQPNDIEIQEDSTLIKRINIICSPKQPNIFIDTKWNPNAITVAGGNGKGQELNQLNQPYGIYIDYDQTIYVAEWSNHRVVEWKKGATIGRIVAGGNGQGDRNDQLNCPVNVIVDNRNNVLIIADRHNKRVIRWPRQNGQQGETIISNVVCWGLAMDENGYLYVSDFDKHEVRKWKIGDTEGILVAGGNGKGCGLNQFNNPFYIFVDGNESVYVSDFGNYRVMKWLKGAGEGIIVAGGQNEGNDLTQLLRPKGIFVDHLETIYIVDGQNSRIMRWLKGSAEGKIVVGGNNRGNQANQLNEPVDLSFDKEHNLYVLDRGNHRVQKFSLAEKKCTNK